MSMKLKKVSYVYSEGDAFEPPTEISLEIPDGQFIGIIGHTGSGKSTLIQHLNGLLRATRAMTDGEKYLSGRLRRRVASAGLRPVWSSSTSGVPSSFEVDVFLDVCLLTENLGLVQRRSGSELKK